MSIRRIFYSFFNTPSPEGEGTTYYPMLTSWLYENGKNLTDKDLPAILAEAREKKVESLDLSKNNFSNVQFSGEQPLPNLKVLDISYNQAEIAEIVFPADIFPNLEYLYLYKSNLKSIRFEGNFPKLNTLHLAENKLTTFELPQGFTALETLYLYINPIENTVIRGFVEGNSYAANNCLPFFREYEEIEGSSIDHECKVLLVGNGGVGKTCFVERLVHDRFVEEWNSTHAISIEQYELPAKPCHYLLNLWDFAGQDIYHATHRLFMQSNAIYLLFWDWQTEYSESSKRIEAKEERSYQNHSLAYWLAYAQSQGEGSPVLVVQTKKHKDGKKDPKEKDKLQERYEHILRDFESIDSKVADWETNGLEELSLKIRKTIKQIKKESTIPNNFAALRQALREKQKEGIKTLSFQEYEQQLALPHGIEDKGKTITPLSVLENWLVKTGVCFYRQGMFGNEIILDQAWAIKAIYTLFDREGLYYDSLQNKKGQFSGIDLQKVWQKDYKTEEQELFVRFMLSCELCFETTPKEDKEKYHHYTLAERTFIAPQLLPDKKADLISDYWEDRESWYVKYTHDFLHYGIIQSFIVRTNYLAEVRNIWQKGIFLKEDSARALVETQEKEIGVRITKNGKNLLDKIRNLLAELQKDKVKESVSLNGVDYVLLENLKHHHPENKYIKAESGKDVLVNDLRFFLEINKENTFKNIIPMEIRATASK